MRNGSVARAAIVVVLALSPLVVGHQPVWASPGDLDRSFGGGDGWAHSGFTCCDPERPTGDGGKDLAVQPNGRIVQLGYSFGGNSLYRMAIFRSLPDGRPDPSFGAHNTGGRVIEFPGEAYPGDVALQPDGKIVVAGINGAEYSGPLLVFRYTRDGTLDRSFGEQGRIQISPLGRNLNERIAVAVQADGRILVGGSGGGSSVDFVLVRFLPDGSLDGSFGQNGITTVDFGRRTDRLADLEIGGRGRIIVGGTVVRQLPPPPGSDSPLYRSAMGVTRLLEDGTLDEGFGRGGRSIVRFFPGVVEDGTYLNGLAAQTDGSLVFAGSGHPYPSPAVSVFARLRRDGELDERFGSHGRVIPETVPTAERAIDVTIDGVDRIVASVFIEQPSLPYQAGVIRLSPDGAPDATFGSGGLAMVGLPRQTGPGDVVLTGGHLIVGGSVQIGDRRGSDFALFAFQH